MANASKSGIMERYSARTQAERYRDRFRTGKRRRTHLREVRALHALLAGCSRLRTILDVGSGAGRFVPVLAAHADHVIQVDYSYHMLDVSRADHPLEQGCGSLVQSDARHLPFVDRCADLVLCHRLLNHFGRRSDREQALAEFMRITIKYVVISCLAPPVPLRLLRRAYGWLSRHAEGPVEVAALLQEAEAVGLRLVGRTRIRSFPVVGEFFTLTR